MATTSFPKAVTSLPTHRANDEGAVVKSVQFLHDIDESLGDDVLSASLSIEPSVKRTVVKLYSVADLSKARKGESEAFLASVRRKHARSIAIRLEGLEAPHETQPLAILTQPLLSEVKALIRRLQPSLREANAREVLRQVRDTLTDGQWELYANEASRATVTSILNELAEAFDVKMDLVIRSADALEACGFIISGIPLSHE